MIAIEKPCSEGSDISVPGDKFNYETVPVEPGNLELVQKQVFNIYRNFRTNPFTAVDRIRERIKLDGDDESLVGVKVKFAKNENGRKVGFAAYRLKRITVDDQELLVVDVASKVIEPRYQNQCIGTRFTRDIVLDEEPDAYTGLTGNPFAYTANLDTNLFVMPNEEEEYPGFVQRAITRTLGSKSVQVTDLRWGICKDVFPHEEGVQRFDISEDKHPLAFKVYSSWLKLGFDPTTFDGKRYWMTVDKSKLPAKELSAAT